VKWLDNKGVARLFKRSDIAKQCKETGVAIAPQMGIVKSLNQGAIKKI